MRMGGLVTASGILVHLLGLITSGVAAWLLLRTYRRSHQRLLFWSSLCFLLLALDSAETFLDYITPTWLNLALPREVTLLAGVGAMLYGFIWEVG